jgi:4,5-dihydroxyphthalate decarboxylase
MARLRLSAGLTTNPRTAALISGEIGVEGVDLSVTSFRGGSELFWRQLSFGDFDISEMSLSSLLILASREDVCEWVGVPIFTHRAYFHLGVMVRSDRGISSPTDLHGRKVAVPEYQQTAAVWTRGVLSDDFAFDPTLVDWYMERVPETSHADKTGYQPPPGVTIRTIPQHQDIGSLLQDGTLDATLRYLPNVNLVDRSRAALETSADISPLFETSAEIRRYHEAHGLFPINHGVVIRRSVVERHPWVVLNVFHAFSAARDRVARSVAQAVADFKGTGILDPAATAALSSGRHPYGISANQAELETLFRYAHEQGMTHKQLGATDIFDEHSWSL